MNEPLTDEEQGFLSVEDRNAYNSALGFVGDATADHVMNLTEQVARLRANNEELTALFDLQRKRSTEAVAMWRAANPGNEGTVPDLGALLTWLMQTIRHLENNVVER